MEFAQSQTLLVFLIRLSQQQWNVMNTHLGVINSRPGVMNWLARNVEVGRNSAPCSDDCFFTGAYSTQLWTESADYSMN
jgi:hypothetical protein